MSRVRHEYFARVCPMGARRVDVGDPCLFYLDWVNISIAGPSIEHEFGLDHIRSGWAFSAWVLGYALFRAPSGRRADRFGPRKILLLGALRAVFTDRALFPVINMGGQLGGATTAI